MKPAQYWIDHLGLLPHPEGGFYKETYRSKDVILQSELSSRYNGDRTASTAIYFLLRSEDISHLHKIDSDEMWHFYAGSALTVHMLDEAGLYTNYSIGADPEKDQAFQAVVPAGIWFGSTVDTPDSYALVGCTVAPGFEFSGFQMAKKADMLLAYPEHTKLLNRITLP